MQSGEPLDYLVRTVDPRACQVINLPDRIWILGGPCNHTPDKSTTSASLRDAFWKNSIHKHLANSWIQDLDRPENYPDWWAFSGYDDLLEFERDACYLARAIVLFAESPGSLAELGALAIDDSIIQQLIVVVQSRYLAESHRQSFLTLGPLKRVEKRTQRCVIGTDLENHLPDDDFDIIIDFIENCLPRQKNSTVLRTDNPTHRLLLMADLIDLLIVSKIGNIQDALQNFDIRIDELSIKRALALLDFFKLIKLEHRGTEIFAVRTKESQAPWINYVTKTDRPFDRSRFKTTCMEFINKDRRRASIFGKSQ